MWHVYGQHTIVGIKVWTSVGKISKKFNDQLFQFLHFIFPKNEDNFPFFKNSLPSSYFFLIFKTNSFTNGSYFIHVSWIYLDNYLSQI